MYRGAREVRIEEAEGAEVVRYPPVSLWVVEGVVVGARVVQGAPADGVVRVLPSHGQAGELAVEAALGVKGEWGYRLEATA